MTIFAPAIAANAISAASAGGAGIGAAAGGLGAAGAGALGAALFNPATIGIGVAFAALSLVQGLKQRNALKRQYAAIAANAYDNLGVLNNQIFSTRRAFYDQTGTASQSYRQGAAALVNAVGTSSGPSVNAVIGAQVANANLDQLARSTALADSIQSIEYQKRNVKAQAEAGIAAAGANYTPPGIQAIQGAVQGVQAGYSLNGIIQQASQASALNEAYKQIVPNAQFGDANALAQLQAINAGIPPSAVLGSYGSLYTAPFLAQGQLSGIQLETSQNDLFYSQLRNESLKRQLGVSTGSLNNLLQTDRLLQTLR